MNARNRVFVILGLLTVGSGIWCYLHVQHGKDLQLVGTVDANEVLVSSRIEGRVAQLTVEEGQEVKAGQLIAVLESDDLTAAQKAAEAAALAQMQKVGETVLTERQTRGEVSSASKSAEATLRAAEATLRQAEAQFEHQKADTTRTVDLAAAGVASAQARDEATTSLRAAQAAVESAQQQVQVAEGALHQAHAHELLAQATLQSVAAERSTAANTAALAEQARVQKGYAVVVAPVAGRVQVKAARVGEVVTAGQTIVSIMDLGETWVYAPLPETQADLVKLGDALKVELPSGTQVQGTVIAKSTEADFATQRDVNSRKRDIRTVRLKLRIPNESEKFVPGMTAQVYIPGAVQK